MVNRVLGWDPKLEWMYGISPEISLAIVHAAPSARDALKLIWTLDARLADILRTTTEPLIGEMRLTWWRDALDGLGEGSPPAEPLLRDLSLSGLDGASVAPLAEGWADLLEPFPIPDEILTSFAERRGGSMFAAGGSLLGADFGALRVAGEGWALADFAFHCSDRDTAGRALALARPLLDRAFSDRWPKRARPLGMIAALARRDAHAGLGPRRLGSPGRQLRMLRHRLTGR
jgi:phytoene synthase